MIKSFLKSILTANAKKRLKQWFYNFLFSHQLKRKYSRHKKAIERVKRNKKIKVVIFAIFPGIWKVDSLYRKMIDHPVFEPEILICPINGGDKNKMLEQMELCKKMFIEKGYPVKLAYDETTNSYLDVKKELNPDIIFFTNPYQGRVHKNYYITNFPNVLTCYVPYSSMVINSRGQFSKPMTNLLWKYFVDSDYSREMAGKYSNGSGNNVVVSGFPSLDLLLDKTYQPANVWKHNQQVKIIWAPHHTIEGTESISFTTFFQVSDFMIEMAREYSEHIQIAFKPHPLLFSKLCDAWGNEKAEKYYSQWREMPNTQIETGDYIDLFLTSDAMLFDSCSFLNEYIYTKKPSAFINFNAVQKQLNEYGLDALNCHQLLYSKSDITNFVESLINGIPDPKTEEKKIYHQKYISMFEEKSASDRILSEILNSIHITTN